MPELIRMPEVAANMESAVLSTWLIAEGAAFSAREVIAVIETDKAVVDFEAEAGGTLVRKLVADGADVPVGAPIALMAAAGEEISDVDGALSALGLTGTDTPAVTEPVEEAPEAIVMDSLAGEAGPQPTRRFSSPLARKMARDAGLELAAINGTGPGGRIVRRDVAAAIVSPQPSPIPVGALAAPRTATTVAPAPAAPTGPTSVDTPHTRLRRTIAARLTESKQTAPHFYVKGTADVGRLLALREEINDGSDVRISVNDLVIKAVAQAHLRVPAVNVIWTADVIRSFSSVDISVAIATPNGLITPVLRSVERMTVTEVARTVKDYAERARSGRIQQSELEGGSVSVTNLGMFGTEEFAAIINPPQAAIVAVGAARQEPIVRKGKVKVGTVMTVTLSVDHRPVDGVHAAEWMRAFIGLLEKPAAILA
jgi:pyruvate dehydrogenase E2 component (dihydrolipoamide acetyltransferase)